MELKRVGLVYGRKLPIEVIPGGTIGPGTGRYASALKQGDPLVNKFLDLAEFKDFIVFCETYGLVMFRELMANQAKAEPAGLAAFMSAMLVWSSDQLGEEVLQKLWDCLLPDIEIIQAEVRSLMEASRRDPKRFLRQLQDGLSLVTFAVAHWHDSDDSATWGVDSSGDFSMCADAIGIRETCFVMTALATKDGRLFECLRPNCNNLFIQTRNKLYCSEACKEFARRERRAVDPLEKQRRRLKGRLERRGLLPSIEAKCRREINGAIMETALIAVEQKYHLEKQTPGRKPTQVSS